MKNTKNKALTFVLSSLLFTATVLEGLFREYHSSSAALGQQRPEVTVTTQVVKSWGEGGSKNKYLQSQYATTVHRFMKDHTPPAQLHTTNKLKHKVTCSGTVINSSGCTQHSQLRST